MELSRSRVFLDISEGTEPIGRLVIELFTDKAPRTCENFRALCSGTKPPLTYRATLFHRIINEFMIQGGDIIKGDGTGGISIYGGEFDDENVGWREIDEEGLVCMANHGRDTNSSQFFITLAPCPHLNAKHTVFGRVVSGQQTLERMAKVRVDKLDRPFIDVLVSHCGELERRKKTSKLYDEPSSHATSEERDRGRRKRRRSYSVSRSPSPSRGHGRPSASRYRHRHRKHYRHSSLESISPPPDDKPKARRRSDASIDHTLRGRPRKRSRSRSRSPILEDSDSGTPLPRHHRKRSPPPSRRDSRERSRSPGYRRQRSMPNVYEKQRRRYGGREHDQGYDKSRDSRDRRGRRYGEREDEEMLRQEEWRRDGGDSRYTDATGEDGRLGGFGGLVGFGALGGFGRLGDNSGAFGGGDGVVYKGRGAMKYREKRRW